MLRHDRGVRPASRRRDVSRTFSGCGNVTPSPHGQLPRRGCAVLDEGQRLAAPFRPEPGAVGATEPVHRYEWRAVGDLLHVEIKPLGRFRPLRHRVHGNRQIASRRIGWEYVHVAIDDHSRLAYIEVRRDQLGTTCAALLERAVAWLRRTTRGSNA